LNDAHFNADENELRGLRRPPGDWTNTPGRKSGFWLTLASILFAVVFPFAAFIATVAGLGLSVRAYRLIPVGAPGRGLTVATIVLAIATMIAVAMRELGSTPFLT
jgi:hypothetical protein